MKTPLIITIAIAISATIAGITLAYADNPDQTSPVSASQQTAQINPVAQEQQTALSQEQQSDPEYTEQSEAVNDYALSLNAQQTLHDDQQEQTSDAPAQHRNVTEEETVLTRIWLDNIDGVVVITTDGRSLFSQGGSGTGWFWDDQGHIVTNYHVIRSGTSEVAENIRVRTYQDQEYTAEFIGADEEADIAVLKVNAQSEEFKPLTRGDSSTLIPGMTAIAIGHPFGERQAFSMTRGIVSGLSRTVQSVQDARPIHGIIQTDADMNPGNSGGPLLNSSGEVIGVNTQIRSFDGSNSGVGFASPINLVERVVTNIIQNGEHQYPYMGVQILASSQEIIELLGLHDDAEGVYITRVFPETAADRAGIIPDSGIREPQGDGDFIIGIDGVKVTNGADFLEYLTLNTSPGDTINIELIRDDQIVIVPLTLQARP